MALSLAQMAVRQQDADPKDGVRRLRHVHDPGGKIASPAPETTSMNTAMFLNFEVSLIASLLSLDMAVSPQKREWKEWTYALFQCQGG